MKQIYYILFIGLFLLKTSGTYAQDLSGITIYVNPGHGGFDSDDRNIPVGPYGPGDARYNMGNSLMIACAKLGMHFVACTSKNYFPNEELVETCKGYAKETGATITLTEDIESGTKDADVICTDVWVSMGEPDEVWEERIRELSPYKVTKKVMENAGEQAIFLHCLPAFHDLKTKIGKQIHDKFGLDDMEVTDEVFESPQSKVFDEAENRMHTIKAVMVATLGERE